MDPLNFNDLPGDIKSKIFKMNRDRERAEHKRNQKKFNEVLTELNEIVEENGSIEPSLIWEITYELNCELYQEAALDRYLEYGIETK